MIDESIGGTWLTYRESGDRVGRKVREINRWRAAGMPMSSGIRDGQRVRLVDEVVLLAWWRDRMQADPIHQADACARSRGGLAGT
ncbi:hypothetical protein NQ152_00180 [Microbacterium sp. zg.B48]|uniref:hypothetical protein n=1 Tax=Microbacterium sp. zg.B48 TaxID=2969408 RepID=UPI00214C43F7|nr:hypothetical protein [Microbacterium sp. zg.B48]MCR2761920.1 hypothetical protein [Microbacterium sp. zg.B48]